MKVKVLDNVQNENVVTQLVTDRPTNQLTDQLLELLEWLFATKKGVRNLNKYKHVFNTGLGPLQVREDCHIESHKT